jgi:hypothetical protein
MRIGLMLPLGEDDGLGRTPTWPELRAVAQLGQAAEVARQLREQLVAQ